MFIMMQRNKKNPQISLFRAVNSVTTLEVNQDTEHEMTQQFHSTISMQKLLSRMHKTQNFCTNAHGNTPTLETTQML
jgi:hypothetical protein